MAIDERPRATQRQGRVPLLSVMLTVPLTGLLAVAVAVPPASAVVPTHPTVATKVVKRGVKPTSIESQVFKLTNQARRHARYCGTKRYPAVRPLTYNRKLGLAARRHSQDMAHNNYFSHTNLLGLAPWDRIAKAGYGRWRAAGENIAAGQRSPREVVNAWLKSPAHCSGIMSKSMREIGVGFATGRGKYRLYWTQDFATKR